MLTLSRWDERMREKKAPLSSDGCQLFVITLLLVRLFTNICSCLCFHQFSTKIDLNSEFDLPGFNEQVLSNKSNSKKISIHCKIAILNFTVPYQSFYSTALILFHKNNN